MATKTKSPSTNGKLVNRIADQFDGDTATALPEPRDKDIQITAPNIKTISVLLVGTSPLVVNRFGSKARQIMQDTQEAGSVAKKGRKRDPKDFDACYKDAMHKASEGWHGIHAGGFRKGMIDAGGRLAGFHMTKLKVALFVKPDGYSPEGEPLVKITKGEPHMHIGPVRNASGVADLRARPMWAPGWESILTIDFDADILSATDVVNLISRVGRQCGVCEGRPNSKESAGCGWGLFDVRTAPN